VIAEPRRVWPIVATAEAKLGGSDEIGPLVELLNLAREGRRKYKTSNRVTIAVRAMGI